MAYDIDAVGGNASLLDTALMHVSQPTMQHPYVMCVHCWKVFGELWQNFCVKNFAQMPQAPLSACTYPGVCHSIRD